MLLNQINNRIKENGNTKFLFLAFILLWQFLLIESFFSLTAPEELKGKAFPESSITETSAMLTLHGFVPKEIETNRLTESFSEISKSVAGVSLSTRPVINRSQIALINTRSSGLISGAPYLNLLKFRGPPLS